MRPALLYSLFTPLTRLKGVGPSMGKAFARLLKEDESATPVVRDLLFHLPSGVVDRRFSPPLMQAPADTIATFVVKVDTYLPPSRRTSPFKVVCSNETGDITLVFFQARLDFIRQQLPLGQMRVISGKTERFDYRLQMSHPDIIAPVNQLETIKRVEPTYSITSGLTSRRIATLMDAALSQLSDLPEWISQELLAAKQWPSWKTAMQAAHHPTDSTDLLPLAPTRLRLAYDELLAYQLHLASRRARSRSRAGTTIHADNKLRTLLLKDLPFQLTQGQQQVLAEIDADMASGARMVRMLQGDVGSGKTLVALLAMLAAVENDAQAALMVPTEIIALQHYEVISRFCAHLPNLRIALLTGSIKGRERETILNGLADGGIQIIVGTQALFQEGVTFHNLAVTVIDEQHRFGVQQRMALSAKGDNPHILHMSATPIPRSLSMTLYGDMDSSILSEKPAGRQPIITRVVPLSRYEEMMEGLSRALAKGEKIYWICPLVEATGDNLGLAENDRDIAAAESRASEFRARFGDRVGLVHGRIKSELRDAIMHDFAGNRYGLLVATTVVEVGVDVKDATIIVIEQAERFGLSQLHQLRGRVGRGSKPSSCVLLYNDRAGDVARQRLSILRETEDGFRIAEADLRLRGGGDVLGLRQSGLPQFHFADLLAHEELLSAAQRDAVDYLRADPMLAEPRGQALKVLTELFEF